MASSDDIATVRYNTDEPLPDTFTDDLIDRLIDANGVVGASAIMWEQKAAKLADLVNTSEAGASHSFSDLHKNALNIAAMFRKQQAEAAAPVAVGRVRVRKIVRS